MLQLASVCCDEVLVLAVMARRAGTACKQDQANPFSLTVATGVAQRAVICTPAIVEP